jgi:hypothetical protein
MRVLLRDDGGLFMSVPFAPSTELQEELTAYWDVPPNHIGRWTPRAFDSIARQHGLRVVDWELEAASSLSCAWRLATYAVLAKAYDEASLPGRINFSAHPIDPRSAEEGRSCGVRPEDPQSVAPAFSADAMGSHATLRAPNMTSK